MTIKLIAQGIRQGSRDLRIRHLAGRATAIASPKNYAKQIESIYHAITRDWWHYVYDMPGVEVITVDPTRIYSITLNYGKNGRGGYGDCDDIATASGALLRSINMQVLIATTSHVGSPHIFDHVFLLVKPPTAKKWTCFDPVLYPNQPYGAMAKYQRLALWDIKGRLIKKVGPFPPRFDEVMAISGSGLAGLPINHTGHRGDTMRANYHDFHDFYDTIGLGGDDIQESRLRDENELPDFSRHGISGFGAYAEKMGALRGDQVPNVMAQYDHSDVVDGTGYVRTKHFEMDPKDYLHTMIHGAPPVGAYALADDGEVYQYQIGSDGLSGIFKKLVRRVKKRVKRIGKKIKSKVKKFVRKIGKSKFIRFGKKILKTGMKIVRPIIAKLGPIADKIAPVAMLIPGVGPIISTALTVTGRIYQIGKVFGVKWDKKTNRPQFTSKDQAKQYATALAREGQKMGGSKAQSIMDQFSAARDMGLFSGVPNALAALTQGATSRMPRSQMQIGWC